MRDGTRTAATENVAYRPASTAQVRLTLSYIAEATWKGIGLPAAAFWYMSAGRATTTEHAAAHATTAKALQRPMPKVVAGAESAVLGWCCDTDHPSLPAMASSPGRPSPHLKTTKSLPQLGLLALPTSPDVVKVRQSGYPDRGY